MFIEAFVTAWNEEENIQQYIDHYKHIVDKITVLDNYSTDNTVEIALNNECAVRTYGYEKYDNCRLKDIKDTCWKDSKADWVIVGDMDEFIRAPNLRLALRDTRATLVQFEGYQMVSEFRLPFSEVRLGFKDPMYNKILCFKPSKIHAIEYGVGSHVANPLGEIIFLENHGFKLLHYKYIGRQHWKDRAKLYAQRLCEWDRVSGFAVDALWEEAKIDRLFDDMLNKAEVIC